jgi:hypothetical protein
MRKLRDAPTVAASAVVVLGLALAPVAGCAAARPDPGHAALPPPADTTDPAAAFQGLEARLLETSSARVSFRITAEGALSVALDGVLVLASDDRLSLEADGTFGERAVRVELSVAHGEMTGGNETEIFRQPAPARVREAVLIGLTRMGLLHNLARLVAARPPDRAAGGVADWVQAVDVRWLSPGDEDAGPGVWFGILVAGLPVLRLQTVRFPQGEMRVREEYSWQ